MVNVLNKNAINTINRVRLMFIIVFFMILVLTPIIVCASLRFKFFFAGYFQKGKDVTMGIN
jgi:hypothetical protein